MSYQNANWTGECANSVGEAFSVKVNLRLNDAANLIYKPSFLTSKTESWDPADENAYGDVDTSDITYTEVWTRDGTINRVYYPPNKSFQPLTAYQNGSFYPQIFQSTGSSSTDLLRYDFDSSQFQTTPNILFSIHATPHDTGTVNGGGRSTGFTMAIVNRTDTPDTIYSATFKWDATDEPYLEDSSAELDVTGFSLVQEYAGDASIYRFWIGYSIPAADKYDIFAVSLYPNPDGETSGYTSFVAPQVEYANLLDRQDPAPWIAEQSYGQPGSLVVLSGMYDSVSVSPIIQKREREYGVVQGQNTTLQVPNPNATLMSYFFDGCVCSIEAGFYDLDEWEVVAQGSIVDSRASSDLYLNLSVDDSTMKVLEYELPRPYIFDVRESAPYSGLPATTEIRTVSKSGTSSDYDNEYGYGYRYRVTNGADGNYEDGDYARVRYNEASASTWSAITDQTYTIEFVEPRKFRVLYEDGSMYRDPGSSAPKYFELPNGTNDDKNEWTDNYYNAVLSGAFPNEYKLLEIDFKGWDLTTGAYASGDTFEFTTTAPRTAEQLTPTGMVKHLIKDVAQVRVFDVLNNEYCSCPFEDESVFDAKITGETGNTFYVNGQFDKGTRVIDMIQDLLKLTHGSIYPTETGQIGFWNIDVEGEEYVTVNGDPNRVDSSDLDDGVHIVSIEHDRARDGFANQITLNYKDIRSGEDNTEIKDSGLPEYLTRNKTINVDWGVSPQLASDCVEVAKVRFSSNRNSVKMTTTLNPGVQADMDKFLAISDPMVNFTDRYLNCVEKTLDVIGHTYTLQAFDEPITSQNRFRIGRDRLGDTTKRLR